MTPTFATIDGVQRELTGWPVVVDGVSRDLDRMLGDVDGVKRELFSSGHRWERYLVTYSVSYTTKTQTLCLVNDPDSNRYKTTTVYEILGDLTPNGNGGFTGSNGIRTVVTSYSMVNVTFSEDYNITSGAWITVPNTNGIDPNIAYKCSGKLGASGPETAANVSAITTRYAECTAGKGELLDIVSAEEETAYPDDGISGDYWYVKIK